MKITHILPLPIYEFHCDENLTNKVLSDIETSNWIENKNNNRSETDLYSDANLLQWFESCLSEAKNELGLPKKLELDITSCWINKTTKLQTHHQHHHQNSFLSGLFYLSDGHIGGETEFFTENIWWKNFAWFMPRDNQMRRKISHRIIAQKGRLILFPSSLAHSVRALIDNSCRYTISFNTFFSGIVDSEAKNSTRLELKSKSIRDYNSEA
jgi:uncharacterized protein (TIGR02466 family)